MNITGWMKHWTACRKVSAMPDWRKNERMQKLCNLKMADLMIAQNQAHGAEEFYCIVWMKRRMPRNCGQIS